MVIVLWLLVNFGPHVPVGVTYTLLTSDGLPESKVYLRWHWVAASTSVPWFSWLYLYLMNPVDTRTEAWFYGRCLVGLQVRIPPGCGYLSLVSVVCCQVEVSARSRSFFQRRAPEWKSVIEETRGGGLGPLGLSNHERERERLFLSYLYWN
jgi:hypothetical protein